MAEPVTLELLGEQMNRMFIELRSLREYVHEIDQRLGRIEQRLETLEDQVIVQGAILLRLENRMPLTQNNEPLAAMHQQLLRLERRVRRLEPE
jgi:hypothetical protein